MENHQREQQEILGAVQVIRMEVEVRLHADHLEVYYKGQPVERMEG